MSATPVHTDTASKDFSGSDTPTVNGHKHLDEKMTTQDALKHIQRTASVSMSPELFEKFYLSPQNTIPGDFRKRFANPTPLAVLGLVMSLTPFSCEVMGWRGAGGNGAAGTGSYYFMGGLLMILGAIGEWIMGMISDPNLFLHRLTSQVTPTPSCSLVHTVVSGSVSLPP